METKSEWVKIPPPVTCDLCEKGVVWAHPLGGLRCDSCPRPETKNFVVGNSCPTWEEHEWVEKPNGYYKCAKCGFEKTWAELAWMETKHA